MGVLSFDFVKVFLKISVTEIQNLGKQQFRVLLDGTDVQTGLV
jgi:hypothetical protein